MGAAEPGADTAEQQGDRSQRQPDSASLGCGQEAVDADEEFSEHLAAGAAATPGRRPSPSQPWTTVGTRRDGSPAVSADHIVPKVEIMYLPRFLELSPDDMWLVLNAPLNLQWLPSVVNVVNKNSRSAADMQGVDPTWRDAQTTLQNRKRAELTELIATLADSRA